MKFKICLMLLFVLPIIVNFSGCFYSFTGASVPAHLKTVAIPVFDDKSSWAEPNLREKFTNTQIQKFIDDNTLQVGERTSADALLESTIVSFIESPAAISGADEREQGSTESISQKKITITVRVIFRDLIQKKVISDKRYSNYAIYESSGNINEKRQLAIEEAVNRITDDILLGTVSNW